MLDNKKSQQDSAIELLKCKVEQEQNARKMAERQLVFYSREIEYFTKSSYDLSSELTLTDILRNTVELTGSFFDAEYGINAIFDEQNMQSNSTPLIWTSDGLWHENSDLQSFFFKHFPFEKSNATPEWSIISIDDVDTVKGQHFRWFVCINFRLANNGSVWIGFLTKMEVIDEEALHMLEIAKNHLRSGIRRRLSDARIVRGKVKLQETEFELEETRKKLIQSERIASLGQLAAGLAHEINNPIGYMRANFQMLDDYLQGVKTTFKLIQEKVNISSRFSKQEFDEITKKNDLDFLLDDTALIIKTNLAGVEKIKKIVESLKTFSNAGDNRLEKISIYDCVDNALRTLESKFKYQHQIINELENTLPSILSNNRQMQQVFVNLLLNAAHAMPCAGLIKISSELNKEHLLIHIQDSGVGMDDKIKNQIFNPFFTTKPTGSGTGLGLSVVYTILEAHHISINVNSELGKGTCFTLGFPIG
jgi:two-component system NtrC family sensor kinase